ncbi:MAG: RecX family transcriptional regulator [Proteobacteria bacterium]|nr:RecX family transcriptional regulator [Pseudomonadota bacterium]
MRPARTPPPIDAAALNDAALAYLARYAATEAGLRRVLQRRVDRWTSGQSDPEATAPALEAARQAIDGVVANLVRLGALSDVGFAETRARSLTRAGRSRRAVQAALVAKGVAPDLARDATGDNAGAELAAALVLARKRRLGPWRAAEPEDMRAARQRELGVLARAGFDRDTAERALDTEREEADRRIHALRAGQAPPDPSEAEDM